MDIDECENHKCQNNATCYDVTATEVDSVDYSMPYFCECVDGFQGLLFKSSDAFNLFLHCYPGEFCEENIDDCENHGCEAGGRCVDGVGTFSCLCPPGFSGRLCDVDEDECRDNPCSHGATCRDGPGESVFYILIHLH